jgi:hypothetical protein
MTITLESLKENNNLYDELTYLFISTLLDESENAEIYFLEFGKVLRSYCLVEKA